MIKCNLKNFLNGESGPQKQKCPGFMQIYCGADSLILTGFTELPAICQGLC